MTTLRLALFATLLPFASFAEPLLVSPSAEYAANSSVPENIKTEWTLPAAQTAARPCPPCQRV